MNLLKDAGTDMRAESTNRQTSIEVAWNRILSGALYYTSEDMLRTVFDDDSQLDERQFSTLHIIVLGMTEKNLTVELDLTTANINAVNISGNTALGLTSARGDYDSVSLLLQHGASLKISNDLGAEPVHLAAQTGNVDTIRVLVEMGAEVNTVVREFKMTPIHYAAEYQDRSDPISGLANLGVHVKGKDYVGWTPLH